LLDVEVWAGALLGEDPTLTGVRIREEQTVQTGSAAAALALRAVAFQLSDTA
jgi:hypothetical protein